MSGTVNRDGTGSGYSQKVDQTNRAWIRGVTLNESQEATQIGSSYNINTGLIPLTSSTESAVLYFKNNEDADFFVSAIAVGVLDSGTRTEIGQLTVVKNPTGGTIISGASDVEINQNRNFGSSQSLASSLAYKGAEGNTIAGGNNLALFFQGAGRLFATVDVNLKKGNSIALKLNTKTSAGTTNIYAALVGHQVPLTL